MIDIEYAFMHDETQITLMFRGINQHTSTPEESAPIVTYTKDNYVDVTDDEGDVIGEKNEPIDFTNEMNAIISEIEDCVANHDPTPIAEQLTKEQQLENDFLAQKEMNEVITSMLLEKITALEGGGA